MRTSLHTGHMVLAVHTRLWHAGQRYPFFTGFLWLRGIREEPRESAGTDHMHSVAVAYLFMEGNPISMNFALVAETRCFGGMYVENRSLKWSSFRMTL